MSLLPRRGPGRHSQPGTVAVHPGWTLSPTAVTEAPADKPEPVRETAVPASRWTSSVPMPVQPQPVLPQPVFEVPAAAPTDAHWTREWEAVAATRTSPGAPLALHTAAIAAIDAVFGASAAPAAWTAAPAGFVPQPHPAPLSVLPLAAPSVPTLTALDLPMPQADREVWTPLAYEAALAVPAVPPPPAPAPVLPQPPGPVAAATPPRPAPPTMPPPADPPARTSVPSAARQVMERAVRTAPTVPAQTRSTVRLGFTDASVIDLRPDDPIARALHTVADALIGRERR